MTIDIDEKWGEISNKIWIRDNLECRLIKILTDKEKEILFKTASKQQLENLEVAHFISRSQSKKLYYNENNLFLLNYFSHRCLDEFKCPISGKILNKEDIYPWWNRIINNDKLFNWLKENK